MSSESHERPIVISMGLPKTGTTSVAVALQQQLRLRVAHNRGDVLAHCDALVNTMEDAFAELHSKHPSARWIITYSDNASAWLVSVREHIKHDFHERRIPYADKRHLQCRMYGCAMGLEEGVHAPLFPLDATTGWIRPSHEPNLLAAYHRYYSRLFAFFTSRQFAIVDVRSNRYDHLARIHPNLTAPFPPVNNRQHRGRGSLHQCTAGRIKAPVRRA
jgi:hypothetical protein